MWKKYLISFAISAATLTAVHLFTDIATEKIDEVSIKVNKNIVSLKKKKQIQEEV